MNIVVTAPKVCDLFHKVQKIQRAFWSLKRKPKNLKVGEIMWIVQSGAVIGGFRIRKIVFGKNSVKGAYGPNPSKTWRLWFSEVISDDELVEMGILDKNYEGTIKVRGFQGFRYQWW